MSKEKILKESILYYSVIHLSIQLPINLFYKTFMCNGVHGPRDRTWMWHTQIQVK